MAENVFYLGDYGQLRCGYIFHSVGIFFMDAAEAIFKGKGNKIAIGGFLLFRCDLCGFGVQWS